MYQEEIGKSLHTCGDLQRHLGVPAFMQEAYDGSIYKVGSSATELTRAWPL